MKHPLAYIHPEAQIAENVEIGPFVTIAKNVVIGEGTIIHPNVTIMDGARIGQNCVIFPGAVISAVPQDLKFVGEETTVEIGNNTTIRECVTINRGTKAKGKTVIGSHCLLMAYVHVAHDCEIGDRVILVNAVQVAGEVEIDDWAIVGGTSAIHQFVHIGAHAMIGGGAKISKDVPPYVKVHHSKMSYAGINSIGMRRRQFSSEKIQEIQDLYRIVFQSGLNNSDALDRIETDLPVSAERDEIVEFIRNSQRGIIRGYHPDND
jgi:UDP-N-acetylglucosamine acyltransferase